MFFCLVLKLWKMCCLSQAEATLVSGDGDGCKFFIYKIWICQPCWGRRTHPITANLLVVTCWHWVLNYILPEIVILWKIGSFCKWYSFLLGSAYHKLLLYNNIFEFSIKMLSVVCFLNNTMLSPSFEIGPREAWHFISLSFSGHFLPAPDRDQCNIWDKPLSPFSSADN